MKISIIIPTYNEKENIIKLIPSIFQNLNKKNTQIIIVDDNSPDNTAETAKNLSKKYNIKIIKRPEKIGLGTAYITGFKQAIKDNSDLIFSMDADLSHNPFYLKGFINRIDEGYDLVLGSRYIENGGINGWGISRRLISKCANIIARLFLNLKVHDLTTGYRCYRRKVLESINLDNIKSNGYSFLEEILYLAKEKNFKIGEIPIVFNDRTHGKSKLSKKEALKFFITILRLRFNLK